MKKWLDACFAAAVTGFFVCLCADRNNSLIMLGPLLMLMSLPAMVMSIISNMCKSTVLSRIQLIILCFLSLLSWIGAADLAFVLFVHKTE